MPVTVIIPGALRDLAGQRSDVSLPDSTGSLSDALARLWQECPALRDRVMTETGEVRPHINIFVDGQNMRYAAGLATPVSENAEIFLLPALSGG